MQKTLFQNQDLAVRLCYYESEEQMRPHYHDVHQISFLLSGNMLEKNAKKCREIIVPSLGIKPAGFIHANKYGDLGSLILSINLNSEYKLENLPVELTDWRWKPHESAHLGSQLCSNLALMVGAGDSEKHNLAWELVSMAESSAEKSSKSPPLWLTRLRERIHEDNECNINDLAESEGVHPAYLSRVFGKYFGCAPTLYRARSRFSKALQAIQKGMSIADAAYLAGFSDQAHLSRQSKKLSGLAPKKLQQLIFCTE